MGSRKQTKVRTHSTTKVTSSMNRPALFFLTSSGVFQTDHRSAQLRVKKKKGWSSVGGRTFSGYCSKKAWLSSGLDQLVEGRRVLAGWIVEQVVAVLGSSGPEHGEFLLGEGQLLDESDGGCSFSLGIGGVADQEDLVLGVRDTLTLHRLQRQSSESQSLLRRIERPAPQG